MTEHKLTGPPTFSGFSRDLTDSVFHFEGAALCIFLWRIDLFSPDSPENLFSTSFGGIKVPTMEPKSMKFAEK